MNDEFTTSKRDILISEFLLAHGIHLGEDAPDEILDAANKAADQILGKGNNN
nr:hypothetical protein [uncultured Albidiferax sp.]